MPSSRHPSRILVIEDDRMWRTLVTHLLRAKEPASTCLSVVDLASALPHLADPALDLVLLDLNLADSRGLETLERVRQVNRTAAIVVMTAETDGELAIQALRNGAQDYLMKEHWDAVTLMRVARYSREKMASELRLRRSEELFTAISENMMDLLTIVDPLGQRVFTSPSYAWHLGYSLEDIDRIPMDQAVHPEDLPAVYQALKVLFTEGHSPGIEYRLRHQDGSYRVVESHATRFESVRGEGYHALVVGRDVTERRNVERERAEMEVSLRQAQKMESVGQLAAGIAHEINTPIQFVNVNLTFLKKSFQEFAGLLALHQAAAAELGPESAARLAKAAEDADLAYLLEELPQVLQDSIEGVQRVAKIVRAMKEFSHPGITERTLLDVNRLASSAATISRNEWKYVSDLEQDLEEGLPPVYGFAAELSQVFLNLIVNAAHAIADRKADRKGSIHVSTRSLEGEVEVRVRDTGLGIAPEHQSRIFEPFFTTKEVGKGTGQGLTICYQNIVKLHGGIIFFETVPGEGTTFIVRLPAASNPVAPAVKGA